MSLKIQKKRSNHRTETFSNSNVFWCSRHQRETSGHDEIFSGIGRNTLGLDMSGHVLPTSRGDKPPSTALATSCSHWFLVHTRSNLLLRRVTATCWLDCLELSEQRTNLRNNYSFQRLFLPFSPMHKYLEDLSFPLVFEFHKLNIVSVFLFW